MVVNLNGVLGFVSAVDLRFTLERKEFEEVDTPALNAGLGSVFAVKADTAALVADNCVCVFFVFVLLLFVLAFVSVWARTLILLYCTDK